MASFSARFRYAYHVIPLHALKSIWQKRALLSKAEMGKDGGVRRSTTARVDELLGFSDFVHFYLPRQTQLDFSGLRILHAQMGESTEPAFPHLVMVVDTIDLKDEDCTICNFNIAVSRPAYPGVPGGNHARGMAAEKILEHWKRFRASDPSETQMRRSFWHEGLLVPVLTGKQITARPGSVGVASGMPELLIGRQYAIRPNDSFFLFSNFDHDTVQMLPGVWPAESTASATFDWYASGDRVAKDVRLGIEAYFKNANATFPAHLDFDRVRPRIENQGSKSSVLKVEVPLP